MFSSTNNLHLFPLPPQYFPSSSSSSSYLVPPPPLPLPNPTDIYIHQDPLPFLGTTTPLQVTEESTVMKNEQQQDHGVNMSQNGQCYSGFNGFLTKKTAAKKDRHSKIYTAQGLRDRRVRLSIEISRKFFDLQDMLGYDKASKTLDWLLTKSRKAIKELTTKSKNSSSKNMYLDSECELISSETNDDAEKMLGKSPSPSKKNMASFHDVMVKESRAKARARARERTKEKIMSKSQAAAAVPEILNQLRPPPPQSSSCSSSHLQLESCTSSAIPIMQKAIGGVNSLDQSQAMKENNIIGIMWKPSGGPVGNSYPKNSVVISKADAAAAYYNNCNNFYFPTNLPQNWDINVDAFARAQSGFCSIANMDSFSEFQVCGRPWEACNNNNNNNQHLH